MAKLPPNWFTWRGYYREIMRRVAKYNEGKIINKMADVVIFLQNCIGTIIALPIMAVMFMLATITTSYDLAIATYKKLREAEPNVIPRNRGFFKGK